MKRGKTLDWIPLWVEKWLWGSTRLELEHDERAIWIDLLVIASKDYGFVRANEDIPYLQKQLAGLLCCDEDLLNRSLEKCIKYKKIEKLKNGTLRIINWDAYQLTDRHKRRLMSDKADMMSEKTDTYSNIKKKDINKKDIKNKKTFVKTKPKSATVKKKEIPRFNKKPFIDKWNEFASERKLPEIQSITGQREVHLKARISSEDFFSFDELLKTIDEQPWLLGKNDKGWRITFDWIINAANYTKIMEKNYLHLSPAREEIGRSKKPLTEAQKKHAALVEKKREELYEKYKKDFEDLREKKDQRGTELLESMIKTEVANYSKEL